jgi:hypothetical protein
MYRRRKGSTQYGCSKGGTYELDHDRSESEHYVAECYQPLGRRTGGPAGWMITFSSINFETETPVVRPSLCQLFANTDLLHKRGVIPEQIFLGHDALLVPMP